MKFVIGENGLLRKPDVNEIQRYIDWCEKSVVEARNRVREYNKDDEVQKLQAELDCVKKNSLKILSDVEIDSAKKFRHDHCEKCGNEGSYWYNLVATGIGTAIKIKCDKCGEELNITDYGCW